ncbi:hypothetical protein Pen02_11170 [Plantactinospora endophytica]|uniref:DUF3396 domain-containing protein n=1 Tax=Plantactinospora endophytica TaxID=673535 RepID=A0ABQ4DUP9_9ACTN|nr:hypothetical protein Pen02_11170 [Plantactinospora endophytica]
MYDQLLGGSFGQPGPEENGPEPDFVTWLLYLDRAEDPGWLGSLARWWHDEVCRMLLPFVQPAGSAAPATSLTAFEQDPGGRGRRRRPARWADGISDDCAQLSARWFDVAPAATASELDVFLARFAGRRHVRLQISVGFEGRSGRLPLVLPALVELARLVGDATDPAYGEIVVNAGLLSPATMLDAALGRSAESSAEQSRTHLRGYEWVTICPRELVGALGGPERIWASGAFAEVRPLTHGGVLLRATDDPSDYRADRVRAAFRALAPVLPPGRPGALPTVPPAGSAMLSAVPGVLAGDPGGHDLSRVVFADPRAVDPRIPGQRLELGPGLTTR